LGRIAKCLDFSKKVTALPLNAGIALRRVLFENIRWIWINWSQFSRRLLRQAGHVLHRKTDKNEPLFSTKPQNPKGISK
jgi:hypothetical protein